MQIKHDNVRIFCRTGAAKRLGTGATFSNNSTVDFFTLGIQPACEADDQTQIGNFGYLTTLSQIVKATIDSHHQGVGRERAFMTPAGEPCRPAYPELCKPEAAHEVPRYAIDRGWYKR